MAPQGNSRGTVPGPSVSLTAISNDECNNESFPISLGLYEEETITTKHERGGDFTALRKPTVLINLPVPMTCPCPVYRPGAIKANRSTSISSLFQHCPFNAIIMYTRRLFPAFRFISEQS